MTNNNHPQPTPYERISDAQQQRRFLFEYPCWLDYDGPQATHSAQHKTVKKNKPAPTAKLWSKTASSSDAHSRSASQQI